MRELSRAPVRGDGWARAACDADRGAVLVNTGRPAAVVGGLPVGAAHAGSARRRDVKRLILVIGAMALFVVGCDAIEEVTDAVLDDEPSALREGDLPNCSRAVNCCAALETGTISAAVPDAVSAACSDTVAFAADASIDEYQRQLQAIDDIPNLTAEARAARRDDLSREWQNRVEPGCRCFMEETVGTIPDLALPSDCEPILTTGDLEGETCSAAMESLVAAPDLDGE